MPRYTVEFNFKGRYETIVEADSHDEAIAIAEEEATYVASILDYDLETDVEELVDFEGEEE